MTTNPTVMTKLANLIIQKRKELRLTQSELARATGVNESYISRLERPGYFQSISIDFAVMLGKAFRMTLAELCQTLGYSL